MKCGNCLVAGTWAVRARAWVRTLKLACAGAATVALAVNCGHGEARQTDVAALVAEGGEVVRMKVHRSGSWSPGLSEQEQETLFSIAEDTLAWCVSGDKEAFSFEGYPVTPRLREERATFVTLKMAGALRGCIGSLEPVAALYKSVHDNAINAALRDFRFKPVQPSELRAIDVHISILSRIERIAGIDEFKIGEHGIIVEKGMHRAVYLPEVAVEQGWNREQTLSSLCLKAGMNSDAWRSGCTFKVFSSVVMSR